MSTLRPHAVIPITAIFSGIFVSASESPAAARDRHALPARRRQSGITRPMHAAPCTAQHTG
jgi:hypothetical protein